RVGPPPEVGERLGITAEKADVALDPDPLILEHARQSWPPGAVVAGVPERPERADVRVEVTGPVGALHLLAGRPHRGQRRVGAPLSAGAGEEAFEPEPERLDLLQLLH